jgi:chemotaxis protein methyltransferase CheR
MGAVLLEQFHLTDGQFNDISDYVRSICGISLNVDKKELVKARLAKRLRQLEVHCFQDYMDLVRGDATGAELTGMLDLLTTNLTYFFREPQHFDFLAKTALPKAIAMNASSRKLRLWSAGCSSGEEPYSLATTVLDALEGRGSWDAKILATDLSTRMLAKAREGIYSADTLRETSRDRLARHFLPVRRGGEHAYKVKPALRAMVHFARLNLINDWPMRGPFDVIFCRNVMIYFDKATQQRLVQRFMQRLAHGGVLCIGHSESLIGGGHSLRYVKPAVYEKP